MECCALVWVAETGQDMQSERSSLVHPLCGRPVLAWTADLLDRLGAQEQLYLVGEEQSQLREYLGEDRMYIYAGAGAETEALLQASSFLESRSGLTLILPRAFPLLDFGRMEAILRNFCSEEQKLLILEAESGALQEGEPELGTRAQDCIYLADTAQLLSSLGQYLAQQGERADMLRFLAQFPEQTTALKRQSLPAEDLWAIANRRDLERARQILNRRTCERHMDQGVSIEDPDSVYIEEGVRLGRDCLISPSCRLTGGTELEEGVVLGPRVHLHNCLVGRGSRIDAGYYSDSTFGDRVYVEANCRCEQHVHLGRESRLGEFSCLENCRTGPSCRLGRRVLLQDADLGEAVTVGHGTVLLRRLEGMDETGRLGVERSQLGAGTQVGDMSRLYAPVQLAPGLRVGPGSIVHPAKKSRLPWTSRRSSRVEQASPAQLQSLEAYLPQEED